MRRRAEPGPANASTDLRSVKAYVTLEEWREVVRRASAAGMSVSEYLRELVRRDQVDDESGRPVWAPERGDELPFAS